MVNAELNIRILQPIIDDSALSFTLDVSLYPKKLVIERIDILRLANIESFSLQSDVQLFSFLLS